MSQQTQPLVRPRGFDELSELVDRELGPTAWADVTQGDVDKFADATGDHQWIHFDPDRALRSGMAGTIAHGLYSLALGPMFTYSLLSFEHFGHGLNYGYQRVRFPAPLPVGARVRMRLVVRGVERVPGGIQVRAEQIFECSASQKPAAVAEMLFRLIDREEGTV